MGVKKICAYINGKTKNIKKIDCIPQKKVQTPSYLPSLFTLRMTLAQMHIASLGTRVATLFPQIPTINGSLCYSSLPGSLMKTHQQNSMFSATSTFKNRSLPLLKPPRKLLCRPPQGKHVREDYLVVCFPKITSLFFIIILISPCEAICFPSLFSTLLIFWSLAS